MTVKQLIEKLQQLPQDADACYYDAEGDIFDVEECEYSDEEGCVLIS